MAADVISASGYLASICDCKVCRSDRGDFDSRNGTLKLRVVSCNIILMVLEICEVVVIAQKQKIPGNCTTSTWQARLPSQNSTGIRILQHERWFSDLQKCPPRRTKSHDDDLAMAARWVCTFSSGRWVHPISWDPSNKTPEVHLSRSCSLRSLRNPCTTDTWRDIVS